MNAKSIVISFEFGKLHLQICRRPEHKMIEVFATNGSNQSLNERMRQGNVRRCFDFRHPEYPQVGLPLMEPIQRIMIRTQVFRDRLASNRSIKHATECPAIHDSSVNSESDDAPSVLIHDDQHHPVHPQCHRFTAEQIDAVEAVLRMTDKSEPGRATTICRRMVVGGKNPADDILINRYSKRQLDLASNARTSPPGITSLHFHNCTN